MILSVHLIPNTKTTEIVGWVEGALKIRIAAPPIEGRANEALIEFLAERLDLSKSEIEIKKGVGSKYKRIEIPMTQDDVRSALSP
ncbi:MAG: DUF167 domain-containing protein [bacterium]|nr:DUF167 domain-containing protein [bacterium]